MRTLTPILTAVCTMIANAKLSRMRARRKGFTFGHNGAAARRYASHLIYCAFVLMPLAGLAFGATCRRVCGIECNPFVAAVFALPARFMN